MSGHVGEATASPSAREERYWLIERRCKDLCLYLDVLTRNMPRYEKYVLSAKMREVGYLCLELAIAANKKQHKKTDLTRFNWLKIHGGNRIIGATVNGLLPGSHQPP